MEIAPLLQMLKYEAEQWVRGSAVNLGTLFSEN